MATILGQTGHGYDLASLDKNASACTDFYQYANGGWLAANPIPAAYPSWGIAHILDEKNRDVLHEILEAAAKNTSAPKGSSEQKVGDYYATCMDETKIEAEGAKSLAPEFDRIAKIKDQQSLQEEIAHLHSMGINALFASDSTQDFKNSAEVTFEIFQGGLGLPDRDYYTKTDDKSKTIRDEYLKHVAKMFELLGDDPAKAASEAQTVLGLETKLAEASMTRVELRDPEKIYHRMSLAQMRDLTPAYDWPAYMQNIGVTQKTDVNVATPDFFKAMNQQLTSASLQDWQTYLRWHLINSTAGALSSKFVDEDFNFKGKTLQGSKENLPRWKRCVAGTDRALGEALGEVYVKKAFPPAAKARALEMVRNLELALKSDIGTLNWMGEATRKQAIVKLDAFLNKIGYPDKWRDYSNFKVVRGDAFGNSQRANVFEFAREMAKVGQKVDKGEWPYPPPTVNASYNPLLNNITFPAGILQPPFYDNQADDAMNFGGIGAVVGHELTHGFDDQGRQFDLDGNLNDWWKPADADEFKKRTKCVIDEYGGFTAVDDVKVNGELTLGENVADNGGLRVAYMALLKAVAGKEPAPVDGLTAEQRFFLGWANVWCQNRTNEVTRLAAQTDPHSPGKYRVNGTVSNMPEFQKAFHCKADAPMVRQNACRVW